MAQDGITDIVFDVGRVLVDFSYDDFFAWLATRGARFDGVAGFVEKTGLLAYEQGRLTDDQFLARLNGLLNNPVDQPTLIGRWLDLFEPIEDMLQLAGQLKAHYGVYLLSNTSALHWQHIVPRFRLDAICHDLLASFEVGAMKPDPAIFRAAEQRFGLKAESTVFIDDIATNAEGARQCGWRGIHHRNSQTTRRQLQALGVILDSTPDGDKSCLIDMP